MGTQPDDIAAATPYLCHGPRCQSATIVAWIADRPYCRRHVAWAEEREPRGDDSSLPQNTSTEGIA